MKQLRWQLLVVLLALIAIALLLVGQQPASLLPGVSPAPIQPGEGGEYVEGLVGSLGRLNPLLDYYNQNDRSINRLIFHGLIRFDDRGQPSGDLAETWGISQDGKVYNFSIRANANWHDGQPVTSEDVLFTIDLIQNEDIPLPADLREFWQQVEVQALDDKTIQFRLPEPFAPFLDYLTFGVLPEHIWGSVPADEIIDSPLNLQPIGSGPFQFNQLITEDDQIVGVELVRNNNYYDRPAYLDKVVFRYYPDAMAVFEAFQKEEVMGISQLPAEILPNTLQDTRLNISTVRMPRLALIYLNLDKPELPFFQDSTLRRALLMGINRQRIIDRILDSQAVIADGPILPGTWAYYDGIERLSFDAETALSLIKQAEYTIPAEGGDVRAKEGVPLTFELVYPDQQPYQAIAESIRSDWSKLGVQAVLKAVPYEQLLSDYLETGNYQAALADLNLGRTPDPDPYPFWHQAQISGGQNYSRWDDRQASEYLEQARVQVDQAERARRYRNFQVRFTNQMPALPLYYPVQSFGIDQDVQGVRIGPIFDVSDRFNTISDWYLVTMRAPVIGATPSTTP